MARVSVMKDSSNPSSGLVNKAMGNFFPAFAETGLQMHEQAPRCHACDKFSPAVVHKVHK